MLLLLAGIVAAFAGVLILFGILVAIFFMTWFNLFIDHVSLGFIIFWQKKCCVNNYRKLLYDLDLEFIIFGRSLQLLQLLVFIFIM